MAEVSDVVAAVDVGGTRIKAALVTAAYDTLAAVTTPTPKDIAADIGAVVHATVTDLLATAAKDDRPARLVGCGVVVPGLVDELRGVGVYSVNLGWRDLPIRDPVASVLGVPTVVGHDVRAGLLAETRLGAARGARHALFLPVGTGIAGALLLDGAVITADGRAGELGHLVIDPAGPPCGCGGDRVPGGDRLRGGDRTGVRRADRRHCAGAEEVAVRASAGDPDAAAVWARAVAALAQAIVATVTITGVDLVLIGGGLAESGAALLDPLRADVASRLTFQRPPRLERAALGVRAGCLGRRLPRLGRAVILARLDEVLAEAAAAGRGLGAFNVIQLEHAEALVAAAEQTGLPVVLQISENAVRYHGSLAPSRWRRAPSRSGRRCRACCTSTTRSASRWWTRLSRSASPR